MVSKQLEQKEVINNMSSESMIHNSYYLQETMKSAFTSACDAYDALMNYEGETSYLIASNFMAISQLSYVELKKFNHENTMDHYEISPFFTAYDEYIFQLKKFIVDKDENTSWLLSAHNRLQENWKSANEFISTFIKTNTAPSL